MIEDAPADEKFMHAATYSGHPTCCAVGLANVEIMEKEGLPERAAVMGQRLQDGLQTLRSLPVVGDVRGLGMLAAIELVEDQGSRKPAPGLGARVVAECGKRGLITRQRAASAGPPASGDTLCLAPPLMTAGGHAGPHRADRRRGDRGGDRLSLSRFAGEVESAKRRG